MTIANRIPGAVPALLFALSLLAGCAPRPPVGPPGRPARGRPLPPLRVALRVDVAALEVDLPGGAVVRCGGDDLSVAPGESLRFTAGEEGALVMEGTGGPRPLPSPATILPDPGFSFVLGGTPYGGTLSIVASASGLAAVNGIGLEDYLRGVVPWEIGWLPEGRIEALEAQAVAARTYALTRAAEKGELWDLVATESDQVYRGLERTDPVVDRAIRETAGIVATYRGDLLRTYYSSTCGGRTAPLTDVWFDREGAPYLRGVGDGPGGSADPSRAFCRDSPHFRWTERWEGEEEMGRIAAALAGETTGGAPVGRLLDVRIEKKGRSGRVLSLLFETERGRIRIGGNRIRWVLQRPAGGGVLRSTWFTLKTRRKGGKLARIVAEGRGHGHGIGMCQWGAVGMAAAGYRFDEILRHYYPGIRLRSWGAAR